MKRLLIDIEGKLKECFRIQDFKGPRFRVVLSELNHIFEKGNDEASIRACEIIVANNLLEHITTLWKESASTGNANKDTVRTIKALIWNCSDKYKEFVQICVASGHVLEIVIDDMNSFDPDDLEDRVKRNALRADLGILHNVLRQESAAPTILRNLDGLRAVTSFTKSNYHIIRTFALVVLAYCDDATGSLSDDDCKYLVKIMEAARSSTDHMYAEQGLTLEEILRFISKLISGNSDRKDLMIKYDVLENLDQLLDKSKFSEPEILACLELLWHLAVSASSKEALVQQQRIITAVDNCLEAEGTQSETPIRKECSSVSFLLKSSSSNDPKILKHVMISYQWDSQPIILKLCAYLEEQGFAVWLDVNNMKGSLLTSMAEAVENAAIVILGVTKKYGESQNTEKEAVYANQKKIPMVPLMLEKGFQPSGWLGILIAGKLYVDLAEDAEKKFDKVKEQIESILPDPTLCKKR